MSPNDILPNAAGGPVLPLVSVITPTYNRAHLLPRVYASLLQQNVTFEWILVDDGSTDNTEDVILRFADKRIVYKRFLENRGVNAARNAGVRLAGGEFVQFLDSDDEFASGGLDTAVGIIRAAPPSIGAVLLDAIPSGSLQTPCHHADGAILCEYDIVCQHALEGDKAVIYRREVFSQCSLPEDLKGCEHVFVFEVSKYFNYLCRNLPCTVIHRQDDNLSSSESLIRRSRDIADSYERIIRNHAALLASHPDAAAHFRLKAMYKYLVAGERRHALRIYLDLLRTSAGRMIARATGAFCLGLLAPLGFERLRLQNHPLTSIGNTPQ